MPTYKILRYYQTKPTKIIHTGLTLEEAKQHCSRWDTKGVDWFDGYTED